MTSGSLRFLVSTVRRGDPLLGSGDLVEVDLQREIARVLTRTPLPLFPKMDAYKAYGGKRGFRGIRMKGALILVATFDSVLVLSRAGDVLGRLTHRLFSDVHGIEVDDDDVLVTSTGLDAIVRVSLRDSSVRVRSLYGLASSVVATPGQDVLSEGDHRRLVRTDMRVHPNYVCVAEGSVWVTCRALGTIVRMTRGLDDPQLVLPIYTLGLPHDGHVRAFRNGLLMDVTETGGSCVSRVALRPDGGYRIDRLSTRHAGGLDPSLQPSRGRTDWARGLAVLGDGSVVFGQSPGRIGLRLPDGRASLWRLDGHPSSAIFDIVPIESDRYGARTGGWWRLPRLPVSGS